jgi:hypothetical protein
LNYQFCWFEEIWTVEVDTFPFGEPGKAAEVVRCFLKRNLQPWDIHASITDYIEILSSIAKILERFGIEARHVVPDD